MQSIKSPWASTFDQFAGSIQESAIIAAPFIRRRPLERLARRLQSRQSVRIDLLTSLAGSSLAEGLVDCGALLWFCEQVPGTSIRHLLHLHAKAYVADRHTAIVTSANLTESGLVRNFELGVKITGVCAVHEIADDLTEYGGMGVAVSNSQLSELNGLAQEAQEIKARVDSANRSGTTSQYDDALNGINEKLIGLRVAAPEFATDPKESITGQFAEAVQYVLRKHGPMPTAELNVLARNLKPELCDDVEDRMINGQSFGKRWKHDIRNAQQQLKRQGLIVLENRRWRCVSEEERA